MPRLLNSSLSIFVRKLPEIVLILGSVLLLKLAFKNSFIHPGSYLFGSGGDGLKNYYTYLYQIRYGVGTHFSGMMYPFGDHIVYADGQPLLSIPLAYLHRLGIVSPDFGLGLLNALMLWSIPISAFLIYRILRANLVTAWPAVIGALLISFMSPNFERILGHYGLSYTFIIPLYWYLLIWAFAKPSNVLPLIIYVLIASIAGLLHPYWVSIAALLAIAHGLVAFLQHNNVSNYSKALAGRVILAGIFPVILFQLFMAATDLVADRPPTPWGFFYYRSSFAAVFYPVLDPLRSFWQAAFKTEEAIWEGWSYVGLIGLITLILTTIKAISYIVKLRIRLIFKPVLPQPLRIAVYTGLLTLLFACGIPFTLGLENTLEYIKPLKQFRSIGRFAWVFYYTYSVYVVFYFYLLFRYLHLHRAGRFAVSLLLFIILIWAWEAKNATSTFAKKVPHGEFKQDLLLPKDSYMARLSWYNHNPSDYQAILPLPFYLYGAEVTQLASGEAELESMRSSLETGLPMVAASMSRASQSRSFDILQLLSDDVIPKSIINQLPSQKPFLLLVTPNALNKAEQNLLRKARLIMTDPRASLYELPMSAFDARPHREAALRNIVNYTSPPDVVRLSFISSKTRSPLGTPSLSGSNSKELFSGTIPQARDTVTYEASLWVRSTGLESLPIMRIRELDGNKEVEKQEVLVSGATDVYKGWLCPTVKVRLHNPSNRLELSLDGDKYEAADLLIRPAYTDVYDTLSSGRVCKNNLPLQD